MDEARTIASNRPNEEEDQRFHGLESSIPAVSRSARRGTRRR